VTRGASEASSATSHLTHALQASSNSTFLPTRTSTGWIQHLLQSMSELVPPSPVGIMARLMGTADSGTHHMQAQTMCCPC
jgi:hypothetical protein